MSRNFFTRAIAAVVYSAACAALIQRQEARWIEKGRELFLADQSHRFDVISSRPPSSMIIGMTIAMLLAIALYEILARIVTKLLAPSETNASAATAP